MIETLTVNRQYTNRELDRFKRFQERLTQCFLDSENEHITIDGNTYSVMNYEVRRASHGHTYFIEVKLQRIYM